MEIDREEILKEADWRSSKIEVDHQSYGRSVLKREDRTRPLTLEEGIVVCTANSVAHQPFGMVYYMQRRPLQQATKST